MGGGILQELNYRSLFQEEVPRHLLFGTKKYITGTYSFLSY